jgi:hypothetical protein
MASTTPPNASQLAGLLKQRNAMFLSHLRPKMDEIANETFDHLTKLSLWQWDRDYQASLSGSIFSSTTSPVTVEHVVDLTAKARTAISMAISSSFPSSAVKDTTLEDFFEDCVRLLQLQFGTIFYKSGFAVSLSHFQRHHYISSSLDEKGDEDAEAKKARKILLTVSLSI